MSPTWKVRDGLAGVDLVDPAREGLDLGGAVGHVADDGEREPTVRAGGRRIRRGGRGRGERGDRGGQRCDDEGEHRGGAPAGTGHEISLGEGVAGFVGRPEASKRGW